jgi:hypothetical protein
MERLDRSMQHRYRVVSFTATLCCLLGLALCATSAAAATTLNVSTTADSSASSGACGTSSIKTAPSPLSLREAVCLANNIGGEANVNIPSGTYKLFNGELIPGRARGQTVNFTGAGSALTVLDAQGVSRVFDFDEQSVGGINSHIKGVTVTEGADSTFGGAGIIAGSGNAEPADELTLEEDTFTGNVANLHNQTATNEPGGAVEMAGGKLIVLNSSFSENQSFSSGGSALSVFSNANIGGAQGLKVVGSTFTANQSGGSRKEASTPTGGAIWIDNGSGESEITESAFIRNEVSSNANGSYGAAILEEVHTPLAVTRSSFSENKVFAEGGGPTRGSAIELRQAEGQVLNIRYNRFHGNNSGSAVDGYGSFSATENWWGCNGGPGTAGCDGAAATNGSVVTTPRLQFRASASPTTVVGPNGTSTLSANFATDSAGTTISAANLAAFNGAAVTWSDPQPSPATINGHAAPETTTTSFSGGQATATYSPATAAGAGHAVASFDNASQTLALTDYQRPVITGNPSSQMVTPGSNVTFIASATGSPTPTVQWERSTGGAFTPISGATSPTYSFTAAKGETGYQFRAVFTNTIEGTPYPATTTAATLTVGKATTTISTTASNATIGGSIHDAATLAGGNSPSGTITFKVFAPGDTSCVTVLESWTSSVTKNGSYESGNFIGSSVGEYRWTAVYSGDANNEEAVGACNAANEKSVVSKATPSVSTNASNATIGGTIHDSATFINGVTPGGTLTFKAYGPGDTTCSAPTPAFTATVNVTENGSYDSGNFTPATAGEYRWTTAYSGDGKNNGATGACNATNEKSTVAKVTPTLSTTASSSTTAGATIGDTATLAGAYNPGGTIVIKLFGLGDTNCSKTPLATTTDTVTHNGTYQSAAYGPPFVAGEYRWTAVYSGDANNETVTEPCNAPNETSGVGKATTGISTTASNTTLGGQIHDTATLSGGVNPGGTITFEAYAPGDTNCSAPTPVFTSSPVSVNKNGSYESTPFTPGSAGEYRWTATYSGDANNEGAGAGCNAVAETSVVSKASPTISTNATNATVGSTIHDTATLAGGQSAGGTITFEAFGPDDATCAATAAFAEPVPVTGNGEYASPDFEPSEAGEYRWTATYSGDANNNGVSAACNAPNELSTVAKALPTISTKATDAAIGGKIHDTATIAGGQVPVGMITFEAFGPGNSECTGGAAFARFVAVNGNGDYDSPDFEAATAGEYRWTASYSGDGNNVGASSGCNAPNELSTVAQASPTISTVATSASLGNPVHDTATIAAGHSPGGTVTFKVYGATNTTCTGTALDTETVAVSGNGSYDAPNFTPSTIGDYRWVASYSGDANNKAVAGACNDSEETSTITKAVTALSTSATNAVIGSAIEDTATLSGGQAEAGTITFKVYGPNDATCTGPVAETLTATVSGNGTYGSGDFTPAQSGTYRWVATYSGDAENEGKAGSCTDSTETSTVANAMPTISTDATDATIGGKVHDTATIAAGQNPGGTVTFEAFGPGDETCSGSAVYTETVPVAGNGEYGSGDFTPAAVGTYRWIASYSGDGNNTPAAGSCGDAGESSNVAQDAPTISSAATDATLGGAIHDTATLAAGHNPGGTVTFTAYGPNDSTCSGPVAFTKTVPVSGDGSYVSPDFTPTVAGTYRWVVSYSGDAGNRATTAACDAPGGISSVTAPPVANPAGENPPAKPIVPCLPSAPPTAGGYVPKTVVPTGLVLGVRARIHVATPSTLEIATILKYRRNGQTHSVDLGTSSLENPGTRNLRVAIPSSLREVLPLGTKVRLALTVSAVPAGSSSCTEAKQSHLGFKAKVVKVLLPK